MNRYTQENYEYLKLRGFRGGKKLIVKKLLPKSPL